MGHELQIRTVNLELLRAGPPHNQLLSPLTQYLGVCGEFGAGIVTLPYEQRTFERRLRCLNYDMDVEEAERRATLRDTGVEIARILGVVPGLCGTLSADPGNPDVLIHLRLVLSASELALLPFELAKVPTGPTETTESWLALQTRVPVCITRHIRTVPLEGIEWPTRLRILFIAGDPDPDNIPFEEHREVLLEAIAPFRYPETDDPQVSLDGRREQYGRLLTILKDASYEEIERECATGCYTHVHVLTHGAADESSEGCPFGLALRKENRDGGGIDVISGRRFVCALCSLASGAIHRPSVVTVASCNSGDQRSSVMAPGGSFAHTLHQAGIPLVVASQFPLSKTGSISVTRTIYQGLVHGVNPWIFLHQARGELHGRHATESHDWASLVVYEALPSDLPDRLHEVQYRQSRLAINAALQQIDTEVSEKSCTEERIEEIVTGLSQARRRLPVCSPFAMECLGLEASSYKRQAQTYFRRALNYQRADKDAIDFLDECYALLEKSYDAYDRAVRGFLVNQAEPLRREASLHWVLTQMLSLAVVLGKDEERDTLESYWRTAAISAQLYLEHPERRERAWAHASLAELWLLSLTRPGKYPPEKYDSINHARDHARQLVKLYPNRRTFEVFSTARQFARYFDWWGSETFSEHLKELGAERGDGWEPGDEGIVATARKVVRILEPPVRKPRRRKPAAKKKARTGAKKGT